MTHPGYRLRLYLLTALVLTGFGALITRLYDFQIERQDEFTGMMPTTSTITVREPGVRGEIFDRYGVQLARNIIHYELAFNLEAIHQAHDAAHARTTGGDPPQPPAEPDGPPTADAAAKQPDIVEIFREQVIAPLEAMPAHKGLIRNFSATAMRVHYRTHAGLVPFSYRSDLTYDEFAKCGELNLTIPGVFLTTRPQRVYPYGALASHVLGYIQPWEPKDIPETAKRRFNHYIGDPKGADGVETSMNQVLRGQEGITTLLKNENGRIIRMIDRVPPAEGARLTLTLDARAQLYVENVLREYTGRAAAVVMEVETGEVIAMASIPDYNPNDFVPSISEARLAEYEANKRMDPFSNRCIRSFVPGSTFKVPTAIAGIMEGMAGRSFTCTGQVTYGNKPIRCWIAGKGSHGTLSLSKAIQQSCNPYFMILANTIGPKKMADNMDILHLGRRTGIELPAESPGILPGNQAWRMSGSNRVMTPALTAMLAIGQGDAMATPLQLCAVTACVANGGRYFEPRIVKTAVAADGRVLIPDKPKLTADLIAQGVNPKDMELLRKGMWMAVNQPGGTAGRAKIEDIEVAAKTGTAQAQVDGKASHNYWLIAFAPYEKPKYAVCVLVQHADSGGKVCGPIAQVILRGLFIQDEGVKLPLAVQRPVLGHTRKINETLLPKDDPLAAVVAPEDDAAGETGEELDSDFESLPREVPEPVIPNPVITPEVDEDGTVIPRAIPVEEP